MGEAEDWKKDFSPEELTALGEAPEVKPDEKPLDDKKPAGDGVLAAPDKPGDDKGVKPESVTEPAQKKEDDAPTQDETKAAEAMGLRIENGMIVDEDGTKIPSKRWKKLYYEHQERGRQIDLTNNKIDLLKRLGRDAYFSLYPNEAPQGWQPKTPQQPQGGNVLPIGDARVLEMKVEGGTYDGYTLREVLASDPDSGMQIYGNYAKATMQKINQNRENEAKTKQEQENAVRAFGTARAKELFNLDDPMKMTPEQLQQVTAIGQKVIDWQVLNNRLHLEWEDAYKLMTYEDAINKAKEQAATSAIKGLVKAPAIPSIGNGSGGGKETGFEVMLAWTSDQMGKHIDGLSDKDFQKFMKDAPASLRTKFPGVFE